MMIRLLLALPALIVAAWFGLATVQVRDTNRAAAIVSSARTLSPDHARQADSMLSSAAVLNPDREVSLLRAEVAYARNHRARATRTLQHLVRQEPLNIEAWVWLARSAFPNPTIIKRAVRHIALLDPKG